MQKRGICWDAWVTEMVKLFLRRSEATVFFKNTAEGAGDCLEYFAVDSAVRLCMFDVLKGFGEPSGV